MGTWGLRGGRSGGTTTTLVWDYDNGAQSRQLTTAPGGRKDINGNYPVKITNIRFAGSSGVDYISGAGTYNSQSDFNFTVPAGNYGRRQGYPARNLGVSISGSSSGDTRIRNYTGGGSSEVASRNSNFTGEFDFEFVNTPPTSISVSRNVRNVTVSASGSGGSDAGGPSSYTIQYNDNAGSGWTGNATSPATFSNLVSGRTYSFRAWANNGVGSSEIFTSGSAYIPNVPQPPTSVTATTSTTTSGAINVSWQKPASDVAILEYHVYRNSVIGENFVGSSTSTAQTISITDTNRTPRSEHKY